jgi:membrane-bound serine protease (ClpP class)
MNPLLDPNVGYTLLVGGLVLAVLALFVPGTGLIEIAALFALVLATVVMVNIPVNLWALALMAMALIPLIVAIRNKRSGIPLIAAGLMLFMGSLFVFPDKNGGPAVNPMVAIMVSGGATGLLWFVGRKSLQARSIPLSHDLENLPGMLGTAKTDLRPEGSVYVGGENWTARSSDYIPAGSTVRVVRREGLVLEVEKATGALDK